MEKTMKFIKKNSLPLFLILFGGLIFYWTKDYKQVPSGIGPDFFPRIVATLMIVLSALCILVNRNRENQGEVSPDRAAVTKIILTVAALIAMVLLMQYVHVMVGIVLFLGFYLKVIAAQTWKSTLLISLVGTGFLYVMILLLRIPM